MPWEGDRKDLVDYAKKPDTGLGRVKYGTQENWTGGSGKGIPGTHTGGQTPSSETGPQRK